jgi:hypothetical protein
MGESDDGGRVVASRIAEGKKSIVLDVRTLD